MKTLVLWSWFLLFTLPLWAADPITLEEAREFGLKLETALMEKDMKVFNSAYDSKLVVDRAAKDIDLSAADKEEFARGASRTPLGQTIYSLKQDDGTFHLLHCLNRGKEVVAIFRLVTADQRFTYYEFFLQRTTQGLRVADVLPYAMGQRLSDTYRMLLMKIAQEKNKGALDKLLGTPNELIKNIGKISEMNDLVKRQKYKEAWAIYKALPPSVQQEKIVVLASLNISMNLDEKTYEQALGSAYKKLGKDPTMGLMFIDYFFLKKQFPECLQLMDQLDKSIGGDPYLHYRRSLVHYEQDKKEEALASLQKCVTGEPRLVHPPALMLAIYLEQKQWQKVPEALALLKNAGLIYPEMEKQEMFSEFVKTEEYKKWVESEKKEEEK